MTTNNGLRKSYMLEYTILNFSRYCYLGCRPTRALDICTVDMTGIQARLNSQPQACPVDFDTALKVGVAAVQNASVLLAQPS